jgi:2-dehydro-3-deoxygluconokinase
MNAPPPLPEVVTFGEVLAMFSPLSAEPLRYARQFELRWGGAECNFAIALTRLGIRTGWISRLGEDELGRMVLQGTRGEGVDVSRVRLLPSHPTGLYLKQFVAGSTEVFYYRRGSAASTLGPEDLEPAYFAAARWVHLTGITPALSPPAGRPSSGPSSWPRSTASASRSILTCGSSCGPSSRRARCWSR